MEGCADIRQGFRGFQSHVMMKKYHKYVFDQSARTFVGEFESMYANESLEGFDSWHQEDCRQLQRKITLQLMDGYNFQNIMDLGCGKGAFTHVLKKINNEVLGIDISETAISVAASRYPDIIFKTADVSTPECLPNIYKERGEGAKIDLTVCIEILSYLPDWRGLLKTISCHSK